MFLSPFAGLRGKNFYKGNLKEQPRCLTLRFFPEATRQTVGATEAGRQEEEQAGLGLASRTEFWAC